MQAVVLQENLKVAVSFATKIVSTKTQLPILSNFLLEAKDGRLKISATNLETSIDYWVGAKVEKLGKITVPARVFSELIASFPPDKVEISAEGALLKLVCGKSQATLSGIDASEFPLSPEIENSKTHILEKKVLETTLPFIIIAASNDESKPLLTGIRIVKKDGSTVVVATDGYRLSLRKLDMDIGFDEGVVLSVKALSETLRLLSEEKAEEMKAAFSKDKNQLAFIMKNSQITTRLIEGEYPPYERIIPASFLSRAILPKADLNQAVKMASIYARESSYIIKLSLKNNVATVTANTPQIGENKTEFEIELQGDGGEVAFNSRFLQDLLNVFPEEDVVFEMNGPLAPGVFKPLKDQSYLHIIMPVRIQE